jgi:hypothetical protein
MRIPHLTLEKSSNSRLLQILNKQIPQVCPGGGMSRFRFDSRIILNTAASVGYISMHKPFVEWTTK